MPATLHNLPPEKGISTPILFLQMKNLWLGQLKLKVAQLVSGQTGVQTSLAGLQHMFPKVSLRGICPLL